MVGSEKPQVTTAAKTSDLEKLLKAYQSGKLDSLVDLITAHANERSKAPASDDKEKKDDKSLKASKGVEKQYKKYLDQKVNDSEISKKEASEIKASLKKKSADDLRKDLQKELAGITEEINSKTLQAQLETLDIDLINKQIKILDKEMERTKQYYLDTGYTEEDNKEFIQRASDLTAEEKKELAESWKAKEEAETKYNEGKQQLLNSLRQAKKEKTTEVKRLETEISAKKEVLVEIRIQGLSEEEIAQHEAIAINGATSGEKAETSGTISSGSDESTDKEIEVVAERETHKESPKRVSKKERKAKANEDKLKFLAQEINNDLTKLEENLKTAQAEEETADSKLTSIIQQIKELESGQENKEEVEENPEEKMEEEEEEEHKEEELNEIKALFLTKKSSEEEFLKSSASKSKYIKGTTLFDIPVLIEEKDKWKKALKDEERVFQFEGKADKYTLLGHETKKSALELRIKKLTQYKASIDSLLSLFHKDHDSESNGQAKVETNFLADYKRHLLQAEKELRPKNEGGYLRHVFMINFLTDPTVISYALGGAIVREVGTVNPPAISAKNVEKESVETPKEKIKESLDDESEQKVEERPVESTEEKVKESLDDESEQEVEERPVESTEEKKKRLIKEISVLNEELSELNTAREVLKAEIKSKEQEGAQVVTKQVAGSDSSSTLKDEVLKQIDSKLKKGIDGEFILLNFPRFFYCAAYVFEDRSISNLSDEVGKKLFEKLCLALFPKQSSIVAALIHDMSLSYLNHIELTQKSLNIIASLSEDQQRLFKSLRDKVLSRNKFLEQVEVIDGDEVPPFVLKHIDTREKESTGKAVELLSPRTTPRTSPQPSVPGTPRTPRGQKSATPQRTPRTSPPLTPFSSQMVLERAFPVTAPEEKAVGRIIPVTVEEKSYDEWLQDMDNFETRHLASCLDRVHIPVAPIREVRSLFDCGSVLFSSHSTALTVYDEDKLITDVSEAIVACIRIIKSEAQPDQTLQEIFSSEGDIQYHKIGRSIIASLKHGPLRTIAIALGLSEEDIKVFSRNVWFEIDSKHTPTDLAYTVAKEMQAFSDYRQKIGDSLRDFLSKELSVRLDDKITSQETIEQYIRNAIRRKLYNRHVESNVIQWIAFRDDYLTLIMRSTAESAKREYDSSSKKAESDYIIEKAQEAVNIAARMFDNVNCLQFCSTEITVDSLSQLLTKAQQDLDSTQDEKEQMLLGCLCSCIANALTSREMLQENKDATSLSVETRTMMAAQTLLKSTDRLTEERILAKAEELARAVESEDMSQQVAQGFIKSSLENCLAQLVGVRSDKLYDYFGQQEDEHIDSLMKSMTARIVLKDDGTLMLSDEDTFLHVEEGLFEKMSGDVYQKRQREFLCPFLSKEQYVNLAEGEHASVLEDGEYEKLEDGEYEKLEDGTYAQLESRVMYRKLVSGALIEIEQKESATLNGHLYRKLENGEYIKVENLEVEELERREYAKFKGGSYRKLKNGHPIKLAGRKYAQLADGEYVKLRDGKFVKLIDRQYVILNNGVQRQLGEKDLANLESRIYRRLENGDMIKITDDLYKQFDESGFLQLREGYLVKMRDGTYRKHEGTIKLKALPDGDVLINDDGTFVLSQGGKAQYPVQIGKETVTSFVIQQKYGSCAIKEVKDSAGNELRFRKVHVLGIPKLENEEREGHTLTNRQS